ncbi:RING finger domain-containing protein [Endozoicomonas sp. ALC020]|uniref:RING finger domain-containing protein n=1 Tax=Endozoicomonas sp. ALC020 TaxID=3403077 RepID=UPI003BAE9AC1
MNNISNGTEPKCAMPETKAHSSESTSPANNANFKGHQLQATNSSRRVEAALQGKCSICLDPFTNTEIKPLSLLPCFHVYHSECGTKLNKQSCPECRNHASPSTIKIYQNSTSLREDLPLECAENLCSVVGANASISSGKKALCPYPLATFPYQAAENFLENNHAPIIEWLRESFAEKKYKTAHVHYDEKHCVTDQFVHLHEKPAIALSVQLKPNQPEIELSYWAEDINKAKTPEAAFKNLLEDMRTDLLFLSLRNTHPAIFDLSTDLYIFHHDLWRYNAIFINDEHNSVPLRTIFDPSTKSFSWDRLKQELEKKGFEYKKLFETTPSEKFLAFNQSSRMVAFERWEVDTVDDFHSNSRGETAVPDCITPSSQRPVSESRLEIPSGDLDTDSFLF